MGREKAFSTLVRSDHVGALRYLRSHRPGSVSPVVRAGSRTTQSPLRSRTEPSRSGTRASEPRTPSCTRAYPPSLTSVALARAARCSDAPHERNTSSINHPSRCAPAPTLRHRVRRAATPLLSAALALDSPVHAGEPLCFGARVEASSVLHAAPYDWCATTSNRAARVRARARDPEASQAKPHSSACSRAFTCRIQTRHPPASLAG